MMFFMSKLNENGTPKFQNTKCRKCGKILKSEGGFHKHKSMHKKGRIKEPNHKTRLFKSERWTYES